MMLFNIPTSPIGRQSCRLFLYCSRIEQAVQLTAWPNTFFFFSWLMFPCINIGAIDTSLSS